MFTRVNIREIIHQTARLCFTGSVYYYTTTFPKSSRLKNTLLITVVCSNIHREVFSLEDYGNMIIIWSCRRHPLRISSLNRRCISWIWFEINLLFSLDILRIQYQIQLTHPKSFIISDSNPMELSVESNLELIWKFYSLWFSFSFIDRFTSVWTLNLKRIPRVIKIQRILMCMIGFVSIMVDVLGQKLHNVIQERKSY